MKINDKFESLPGVYIMKNIINGKYYVGESLNVKIRMNGHLNCQTQLISKAIKKHGVENFEVSVRYYPGLSKKELRVIETSLIKDYGSLVPYGYNVCIGGTDKTGQKHSEETKKKISDSHKGKTVAQSTKDKISKNSYSRGRKGELSAVSKPVFVYKISGDFYKKFVSYRECSKELGIDPACIANVINGKQYQSQGFVFKAEDSGLRIPKVVPSEGSKKKIICYGPNKETIGCFDSLKDLRAFLKITKRKLTYIRKYPNSKANSEGLTFQLI